MTDFHYGAFCAELDDIVPATPCNARAISSALLDELNAIGRPEIGADLRPDIVANAAVRTAQFREEKKVCDVTPAVAGQYAKTSLAIISVPERIIHAPHAHHLNDGSVTSSAIYASGQYGKRMGVAWKISARRYGTSASSNHRKPRCAAAQLDQVARRKTWDGTKSKQRDDKLSEAEKLSAAVSFAAAACGVAVSLNLGIARAGMLLNSADPKRRMTQSLSKHLSKAGFVHLPYALVFELTPEREGGRLHLHGVIDITGLTDTDLERLNVALVRAASVATGAIGGQRQLDLAPLYNAGGWADYMLKDTSRTKRELGIDDPFMISKSMRRMAKAHFNIIRSEVLSHVDMTVKPRPSILATRSTRTKKDRHGFTFRSRRDTIRLSGERDRKSAGDVQRHAIHQPHGRPQSIVVRNKTSSTRPAAVSRPRRRSFAIYTTL